MDTAFRLNTSQPDLKLIESHLQQLFENVLLIREVQHVVKRQKCDESVTK